MPDLATSLGKVSDNGLTWTYQLKPNLKFEDGTTVTSKDVKYAVERSYAKDVLPNGPGYFSLLLKDPNYPGPYKDKAPDKLGLTSVDHARLRPRSSSTCTSRSPTSTTSRRCRRPSRCRRPRTTARTTSCTRSRPGRTSSRATSSTSSSRW